ncbi:DUF1850 domain-containing protein, partial [Azospirillum brasilense]|nr:DUF1850 domain-containing protein [Azospirillum brasilense]
MSVALCLSALGGAVLAVLPGPAFTLSWTHSVEKTEWREEWRIENGRLALTEARVKGSGAGVESPAGAPLAQGGGGWGPRGAPRAKGGFGAPPPYARPHRGGGGGGAPP